MLHGEGHRQCSFREHDLSQAAAVPGGPFDLIYARLLLFHLPQRVEALGRLWDAVAPGGHLIVQDFDFRSIGVVPDLASIGELTRVFTEAFIAVGADVHVGIRLPGLFRQGRGRGAGRHRRRRDISTRSPPAARWWRESSEACCRWRWPTASPPRRTPPRHWPPSNGTPPATPTASSCGRAGRRVETQGAGVITMARRRREPANLALDPVDVAAIRRHFAFPAARRVVTNNAASTQPPRELLALYRSLAPGYENVHRGQSSASLAMTEMFEQSYDTIARFIGAPGRRSIALYRNTTEAINAVMYSLLTEFRDGDNVVTTLMEHNSNYVPWYAMCREILPRLGRRVHLRLARFDPATGELDLDHLASLIDARTKLVCCTGASNFLGTRTPLAAIRALADASGYRQPNGERRSYLLVDGAQLVPGSFVDVQALGRGLPGVLLPQNAGAIRGGGAVRQGASARVLAAVPVRRRHDRRGPGAPRPGRVQRAAVEVRRWHAQYPRHDRLRRRRCGCCLTWR